LARNDHSLDRFGKLPTNPSSLLIDGHQLADGSARRTQEQPASQLLKVDLVMKPRREDTPAQFAVIVFERDNEHAGPLKNMFAS
jgi:hypothetical protein